jgi:pimeloyl-ACP methyl ester carboxylesterase
MPSCEAAGVTLAYDEHGAGQPILLIHDLASDAAGWAALVGRLGAEVRAITYDRRGYGDSSAPQPYLATTVEEQGEDAAALIAGVADGEGVLVCGEGFGGLIALDLIKRYGDRVRAAVVSNPPLYPLVPAATAVLSGQRELLERKLRDGGPGAAVAAWLGGRVDGESLARAQAAYRAFFADFAGLASWPVSRAELRAFEVPVVVVTGPETPEVIVAAADALAAMLGRAERRTDGDLALAISSLEAV